MFGSLNVDSTSYVDAFPAPGETIRSHDFQVALGGKGSNQAVAAHVAGAAVELVARVGADAAGDFALATLERLGLPTGSIARETDAPTGVAQITVADSGENTIVVTGGANLALTPAVVDDERERIAAAGLVLTQGEVPVATIDRLAAPRVTAVDTTGAGDAFTGMLAALLAEGRPLDQALRLAVTAGALAVQARGTVGSYAPRHAVLAAARVEARDGGAAPA